MVQALKDFLLVCCQKYPNEPQPRYRLIGWCIGKFGGYSRSEERYLAGQVQNALHALVMEGKLTHPYFGSYMYVTNAEEK
jgi:hypothetical protein